MKTFLAILLFALCIPLARGQETTQSYSGCFEAFLNVHFNPETFRNCILGQTSPAFDAKPLEGEPFSRSKLEGKVVLLNFWFTGCRPCIQEIPHLNALAERFRGDPFQMISFAPEDEDKVKAFVDKYSIKYPVVANAKRLIEHFQIHTRGYPTTIVIDKNWNVLEFTSGVANDEERTRTSFDNLAALIEGALRK